jgi:polyisoprenoid-binding protein YceI
LSVTTPTTPSDHVGADDSGRSGRSPARWAMWIVVGVLAVVALGFGAILVYANFINDPADELTTDDLADRLARPATDDPATTGQSTDDPATTNPAATVAPVAPPPTLPAGDETPTSPSRDVDGEWRITDASELGYRVEEILFGVNTAGVGRTNDITGSLTIDGTQVTAAEFEVDMATVESDDSRRDGQFRGRIMTVAEFPTADFVLTEPIELGEIPAPGEQITATATGDLTLRGVTNSVTFDVTAQLQNDRIGVLGNIPVVFADYDIVNPSIAGITTEDNGLLEFVLVFER